MGECGDRGAERRGGSLKNKAVGLNFIDTQCRSGVLKYAVPTYTPGTEAAGVVKVLGPGVTGLSVGDVVALGANAMGSYAEEQILPVGHVVLVPPAIDPIIAAAVLIKGMTAHYLLHRCFKVEQGHVVRVHAAAGGTGSLLCQWEKVLGATVIGTVSTREKAVQAKKDGCDHVIVYTQEDFCFPGYGNHFWQWG